MPSWLNIDAMKWHTNTVGYVDGVMDSVSEWEIADPGSNSIRVNNFHIQ